VHGRTLIVQSNTVCMPNEYIIYTCYHILLIQRFRSHDSTPPVNTSMGNEPQTIARLH